METEDEMRDEARAEGKEARAATEGTTGEHEMVLLSVGTPMV